MSRHIAPLRGTDALLMLPGPPEAAPQEADYSAPLTVDEVIGAGSGGRRTTLRAPQPADILRAQRDAMVRARDRLLTAIRELEAENAALRRELARYRGDAPIEQRDEEAVEARCIAEEEGVVFHQLPGDVYPGRPYVTQQDLIGQGITQYSRQTISRLARDEKVVPAIVIADRLLLPPEGVRALLRREREAAGDTSPRRRPGGERGTEPPPR